MRLARPFAIVSIGLATLAAAVIPANAATAPPQRSAADAKTAAASTASAPYSLATTRLSNGKTVNPRWNRCQRAVVYRINAKYAAKTKKGRVSARKDVRTAIAKVSSATGITFRYAGTSPVVPNRTKSGKVRISTKKHPAELLIAWSKQSKADGRTNLVGSSHGVGGFFFSAGVTKNGTRGSVITSGYVDLASEKMKIYKPGFGKGITRGAILLHEIGHAVGLKHVNKRSQLMYPIFVKRAKTVYAKGDRAGLDALGRSAPCLKPS